jgi:DNA-binding NtrC family response regulator
MAVTATAPVARILIADDEEAQRNGLASIIRSWGFAADTAADGQEALEKLLGDSISVLITDLKMPRMDGFELLRRLPAENLQVPAIVLTAFGNIETAVSTIHELGAFWFMEKPIQPSVLRVLLERAITHARIWEETQRLQRQLSHHGAMGHMAGNSPAMRRIFALVAQVAPSKAAILITGESGTGKELVARALHTLSHRAGGPFVALNCAAMPESLIESELFGHEKGAFTGALVSAAPDVSNSRRAEPSCSMRSAICRSIRRPNCFAFSRTRRCAGLAAARKRWWMCASSRPPTRISWRRSGKINSVRTCSIG